MPAGRCSGQWGVPIDRHSDLFRQLASAVPPYADGPGRQDGQAVGAWPGRSAGSAGGGRAVHGKRYTFYYQ